MDTKRIIDGLDYTLIVENENEIPLYREVAANVLSYLRNNSSATFNELISCVQGSDRRTLRLLDQLVNKGVLGFSINRFYLPKNQDYEIRPSHVKCASCGGKMVTIEGKMQKIYDTMKEIYAEKPRPTFVFDQRPVTAETTVRRVSYLIWRGDIQGKRIAILGDDDLTSIAIALTGMPKELVVFDIDQRLVSYIKDVSKKHNLAIKTHTLDLTQKIPTQWLKHFDVFMADPTPTKVPFTVFTNAGIRMIDTDSNAIGYLSFYPSCMQKKIELQKILSDMNLLITDNIPFFTEYDFVRQTYSKDDLYLLDKYSESGSKMSFYEHLVRVESSGKTKPMPMHYSMEELLGRATKRVMDDPDKDPALSNPSESERSYLKGAVKRIMKTKDKVLTS